MKVDSPDLNETVFADNGTIEYNSLLTLSEWYLRGSQTGNKELRGELQIKTIKVSAEENTSYTLTIIDTERSKRKDIPSTYVSKRNVFIGGKPKNKEITIVSDGSNPMLIKSVSLEGQYNVRSKMV